MPVQIEFLDHDKSRTCEEIMRALPGWFGLEQPLLSIAREAADQSVWTARVDGQNVGCVALKRHNEYAAELSLLAVLPEHHRCGIGRALVAAAEAHARQARLEFLTVKTLGPSDPDEGYARTRAFYLALGFRPLEEFKSLWGDQPCLFMAKPLSGHPTR